MINYLKNHTQKLLWQLFLVLLVFGTISLCLFRTLWHERNTVYTILSNASFLHFPAPSETLWSDLHEAAALYEVPESEKDTARTEKMQPFFSIADEYTSIYIYGITDGRYRAGQYASHMDSPQFRSFFDTGYRLTEGAGEEFHQLKLEFKNGLAEALIYFYHSSWFIYPYFYFCIIFCVLLFLTGVLSFLSRKMKRIVILEREILRMSSGDLEHPIPIFKGDEIGTLSRELDHLRLTLSSNIRKEQESRLANQDLITAMSHDLRTPLTILSGYLEILKLGRNPAKSDEYLERCLKKTGEIREMTDRMFEYALVYEETENVNLQTLPGAFLQQCLMENVDYIRLTGFIVEFSRPDVLPESFSGDETMLRRIFNNLFSNILKYGDKKMPVYITGIMKNQLFVITISNAVRQEYVKTESNHIGLKSVEKMILLMKGSFEIREGENRFEAVLSFSLDT